MDSRAVEILLRTYGPKGDERPTAEAFLLAKRAGVMSDPVRWSHDEVVRRAVAAAARLRPRDVADAFLASLASRWPGL